MQVILTGAPGTGKSALIAELATRGWDVREEVSRQVIAGEGLTPWDHPATWALACAERMGRNRAAATTLRSTLFDRAEMDLWAYLRHAQIEVTVESALMGYAADALIAPLWPDIFQQEPSRPQSWADAVALDARLREVYAEAGFTLHEVPLGSVPERADWVEEWLEARGALRKDAA
ncbi:AAA family ATPase [Actomonas aquatica]|uniref:AAA family ATPase n=1 Tax=Actomonas aquatica TaxID=2866162 RepID=A0ABZ1CER7_9BACT|nr:AAA family ATPase [Opitutus sp. WL0086]WRQ89723.1 AAA family ATPase [Opitutus sp. WL0086]